MNIARTRDADLVKRIIGHPKIYPHVSEDGSVAPEALDYSALVVLDGIYFLAPMDEERVAGVFMVQQQTLSIYEVHTCILPEYWGRAEQAGRLLIEWVFANTRCNKLITRVPKNNRLAHRLAVSVGMTEQGCITESYMQNGVLLDQIILGIGRREACPQPSPSAQL